MEPWQPKTMDFVNGNQWCECLPALFTYTYLGKDGLWRWPVCNN